MSAPLRRKEDEESYFSNQIVGMTQIFGEDGSLTPVTVLQAGPCVVTQVKTVEKNDGYSAVQVGFVDKREKLRQEAPEGDFDKAGVSYKRYVRELKLDNAEEYALGAEIKADAFAAGDKIDATAISKGKGFQGAIKKTRSAERTDGTRLQVPSSCRFQRRLLRSFQGIQGQEDGRSHGQQERITIQNLEVVRVDADANLILVKGSVPGPKKSLVTLRETVKA